MLLGRAGYDGSRAAFAKVTRSKWLLGLWAVGSGVCGRVRALFYCCCIKKCWLESILQPLLAEQYSTILRDDGCKTQLDTHIEYFYALSPSVSVGTAAAVLKYSGYRTELRRRRRGQADSVAVRQKSTAIAKLPCKLLLSQQTSLANATAENALPFF